MNSRYINEIDGLRGFAVGIIVLFHFGVAGFEGGFIGVDIFFVISGFLITRNIRQQLDASTFTLLAFYSGRVRRLFPALLVVLLLTLIAGGLVLSPTHYEQLGRSALWALASLSNMLFYSEVGYFDTASYMKPLLHLWSLGVEEQFYLLWPLLLIIFSVNKSRFIVFVLFSVIASGIAAELVLSFNPSAAFYFMPLRGWEFAIGACGTFRGLVPSRSWINNLVSIASLVGLSMMTYGYSEHIRFPALTALPVCLATLGLLICAPSSAISVFLRRGPLAGLGRISYSVYLIHWPVVVLYSYWSGNKLTLIEVAGMLVFTILTGALMYRYVEMRFRRGGAQRSIQSSKSPCAKSVRPSFWIGTTALTITIAFAASALQLTDGLPSRSSNGAHLIELRHIYDGCLSSKPRNLKGLLCELGQPGKVSRVLVIGDSHAAHLVPGWKYLSSRLEFSASVNTHPGCAPLMGVWTRYGDPDAKAQLEDSCRSRTLFWESEITSGKYDVIVLAARWANLFETPGFGQDDATRDLLVDSDTQTAEPERARALFYEGLKRTVSLIQASGANVLLVSQVPPLFRQVQDCDNVPFLGIDSDRLLRRCAPGVSREATLGRLNFTDTTIQKIAASDSRVLAIMPSTFLCPPGLECLSTFDGVSLYRDDNHLSVSGSLFIAKAIEQQLGSFLKASFKDDLSSKSENVSRNPEALLRSR